MDKKLPSVSAVVPCGPGYYASVLVHALTLNSERLSSIKLDFGYTFSINIFLCVLTNLPHIICFCPAYHLCQHHHRYVSHTRFDQVGCGNGH